MATPDVWPGRHRFTVGEYHRMADAGLFGEEDRIELLDGDTVELAPMVSRHGVSLLGVWLVDLPAGSVRALPRAS